MKPKNIKTKSVRLELTDKEHEALDKYLYDNGLTKSGLLRTLVLAELKNQKYIQE